MSVRSLFRDCAVGRLFSESLVSTSVAPLVISLQFPVPPPLVPGGPLHVRIFIGIFQI